MAKKQERGALPAAPPDSDVKPRRPTQLTRSTWAYVLRRTGHEFLRDQCTDSAAVLTFFAVLSIFPGLLAVVSLLGVLGQAEATTRQILDLLREFGAPAEAVDILAGPVNDLTAFPAAGLTLATGLAGSLWTSSGYIRAFGRAMNRIYEVEEGRPLWKLYPMMLGITLSLVVLVVGMVLILLLSGPVAQRIGDVLGIGGTALAVWNAARVPVLLGLLTLMIVLLYYTTPNIRQPRFRWLSIGSGLAIVVMALATTGFSFYVANFGSYNTTYGTIGGVIVLLLWIWIMNIVLLAGAELNAETERGRELQAGLPAARTLRLPPRDARQIRKLREAERRLVEDGDRLRERHAPSTAGAGTRTCGAGTGTRDADVGARRTEEHDGAGG